MIELNKKNWNQRYIDSETYPGSVERRCPDLSKSKKILNYYPKIDWKYGLIKTLEWYKRYFVDNNYKKIK